MTTQCYCDHIRLRPYGGQGGHNGVIKNNTFQASHYAAGSPLRRKASPFNLVFAATVWLQKGRAADWLKSAALKKIRRRPTLPQARPAVPLAMGPFTSVFGMGTGVSSPLRPPEKSAA